MHALEGVRLIDFGQYLAGPFGPMLLADLGAEVIKVEPVAGDNMRFSGTPFTGCQRGKRDIALNIKTPDGLELAYELVRRADVVHHNMTLGTADKLGLGYEKCKEVKPDLVYCNTFAYGYEGPLAHVGGLDPLYQASAGLEYESGAVMHGHEPLYYRFGMCDASNALLSVVGVLAAVFHQRRTGEGQYVWTSLLDGGTIFSSDALLRSDGSGIERWHLDAALTGLDPAYRLYETKDGWLQIVALRDEAWETLCATMGVDATLPRADVEPQLEAAFMTNTAMWWWYVLDRAGVPCEIAADMRGGDLALYDGDHERLGLVTEYEHALLGTMRQAGNVIDFSETPGNIAGPPPLVGEHTREILDWLGVDAARQEELKAAGVVYWPDENYAWPW